MFLPTILTGGFLLIVGWVSGALDPELICAAIAAGIPGAALDIAHRRGFTDRHVHDRSRRGGFIALMAGCLVLAGVIAALRSTPRLLAAVLVPHQASARLEVIAISTLAGVLSLLTSVASDQ